jgi:hypothetical protein
LTSLPINQDNLWKKRDVKFLNDFMLLTKGVLNFKNECNLNNKLKNNE